MAKVELTDQEWQVVINWIGTRVVWAECNGLLMKMGQQLQQQQADRGLSDKRNSEEMPINTGEMLVKQ